MATEVVMPQFGESVVEGTITKWLKSKGDQIEEYEPLVEVNTDKVDSEIPSPAAGVLLDILVPEGTTIHAGTVLARIGEQGEAVADSPAPEEKQETEAAPAAKEEVAAKIEAQAPAAPPPGRSQDLGFISPVVAKIAREHNLDLAKVTGTGSAGRITKQDVLAYLEKHKPGEEQAPAQPAPVAEVQPSKAAAVPAPPSAAQVPPAEFGEVVPLNAVRKAIAEHMVLSRRTSPHVSTIMEADLSRVVAHREANKAAFAHDGANLTYTAYFVAASVAALKAYPLVNSSWTEEGIRIHPAVNIGIAASMGEAGLIVPVIKNADTLSLLGIARIVNDLATRARARQLKPDEVKGGTFTITNHGVSGSLFATPIINQPQCAILGAGAIQKRVVVINDAIAIRPMIYLSLTFDHRILDGAIADYFLGKVVESLQNWV